MISMDIFEQLRRTQKFTGPLIQAFAQQYGDTFYKALKKLESHNLLVYKYHFHPSNYIIWIVQGQSNPYILYPGLYCECYNFMMTAVHRNKQFTPCKHLLAQRIAETLGQFQIKSFPDTDFNTVMAPFLEHELLTRSDEM